MLQRCLGQDDDELLAAVTEGKVHLAQGSGYDITDGNQHFVAYRMTEPVMNDLKLSTSKL